MNPEKLKPADYKFLKIITLGAQWKTVHPGLKSEITLSLRATYSTVFSGVLILCNFVIASAITLNPTFFSFADKVTPQSSGILFKDCF